MGLFGFGKKKENQLPGAPLQTPAQQASSQPAPSQQSQPLPPGPVLQDEPSQLFSHPQNQASPMPADDLSAQVESIPTAQPPMSAPEDPAVAQSAPQEFSVPDFSDDDLNMTPPAQTSVPAAAPTLPPNGSPQVTPDPIRPEAHPITAPQAPAVSAAPAAPAAPVQQQDSQDTFQSLSQEPEQQDSTSQGEMAQQITPTFASYEQAPPVPEDDKIEPVIPEAEESGEEFGFSGQKTEPAQGLSFASDQELAPIMPDSSQQADMSEPAEYDSVQEPDTPAWTPSSDAYSSPPADFSLAPTQTLTQEPPEPIEKKVFVQKDRGKTNVFVEKDAYEEALLSMIAIEEDVSKAADHLGRVIDDESIVSSRMKEWHDVMNEIQEKLIAADTRIFDTGDNDG